MIPHASTPSTSSIPARKGLRRRAAVLSLLPLTSLAALVLPTPQEAKAELSSSQDFTTTASGLKVLKVRYGKPGTRAPRPGERISVHWSGFTAGYRQHILDNTSQRDEPFEWVLGSGEAIPAFEEAVMNMRPGGLVRVELPGDRMEELGYSLDLQRRFSKGFTYAVGPQPQDFGGKRALDFVLDNKTFDNSPFNRTLVFDIALLAVYPGQGST